MIYPTINEKYELDDLNGNFLELYNQINVAQSYTPTASNLGTITTHLAMRKGGVARYKLDAKSGTWTAGTEYTVCTLSSNYRPTVETKKEMYLYNGFGAVLIIKTTGVVNILPRQNMSAQPIRIDETYTL